MIQSYSRIFLKFKVTVEYTIPVVNRRHSFDFTTRMPYGKTLESYSKEWMHKALEGVKLEDVVLTSFTLKKVEFEK